MNPQQKLSQYIDHTLLRANITSPDLDQLCEEAMEWEFKAVCVPPRWITYCQNKLNTQVLVATVLGFPHGNQLLSEKIHAAQKYTKLKVDEIDMVIELSWVLENRPEDGLKEINAIKEVMGETLLKVIVETAYLESSQIELVAQVVDKSKAEFIKTSTGFASRGASLKDIELFKKNISSETLIKASGGIKSLEMAREYLDLGVSRIGTSSGITIIKQHLSN